MNWVEEINEKQKECWYSSSNEFPMELKKYSLEEKINLEKELDSFIDEIVALIKIYKKISEEEFKELWRRKEEDFLLRNGFLNINISNNEMKKGILEITKRFVKEAKEFENDMSMEDIGQALRNVWIITILQEVFGKKVEYSSAIFGYSMLYPFTDNYLDDPKISIGEKQKFNENFTKRLKGEEVFPSNYTEEKVYDLVKKIEDRYKRSEFLKVYESLLEIQMGQVKSITLQEDNTIPYDRDILKVSIEKGGASVIVDGVLIYGDLTFEELYFCIGYGFMLQLGDDLQDVKEDIKNNHTTIFSQLAGRYDLSSLCNKLINFTLNLVQNANCFKSENGDELRALIKDNCILLILFSIVLSKEYFNKEYIKLVEDYLPFRVKYVEKLRGNMTKKMKNIKDILASPNEFLNTIVES